MGAAARAAHLGADQAVGGFAQEGDPAVAERRPEAGPAGARVELGLRREQRLAAGHAAVGAVLVVVPVDAGEGRLGAAVAGHLELEGGEPLAPALVGGGQVLDGGLFRVAHAPRMPSRRSAATMRRTTRSGARLAARSSASSVRNASVPWARPWSVTSSEQVSPSWRTTTSKMAHERST